MVVPLKLKRLVLPCAAGFSVLFLLAVGLLKVVEIESFHATLLSWELIPDRLASPLAVSLPAIEVGLSLLWLLGVRRQTASWAIATLLVLFTVATAWQFIAFRPVDCGCLGVRMHRDAQRSDLWSLIARNAVLVAVISAEAIRVHLNPHAPDTPAEAGYPARSP
jgi:uncharacterized membrane protein YphA (DoxX/SURF4 family)